MTGERKLDETAELEKLVNRSGFPFQLRVEHEIRKTSAQQLVRYFPRAPLVRYGEEP